MIIEIVTDMRSFLVILSIVMVGFSATFMVLLPHPSHETIELELAAEAQGRPLAREALSGDVHALRGYSTSEPADRDYGRLVRASATWMF
jgi:hypothetical protein